MIKPGRPYGHSTRILALLLAALSAIASISPSFRRIAFAQEPSPSPAVQTQTYDKAQLHQALLDLTNPFTVMCVAAHPDDEDGTTLIVMRRKFGAHTVTLFSTYGEGGQNAVGPELYEELGVIRAQETMKAAQIQGSEPYFLGLKDFGFSKSADEAFKFWGHDEALRRMVLKIRELRPDVIITNHDTTSGHGHHQATGRLIIEAFDAAADARRFPEQLNQVKPWQAKRLFVRVFGNQSAENNTTNGKVVSIDPNEVDPVRGTSFAEQALMALQEHATQGPWPKSMEELLRTRRAEAGKLPLIRYRLAREAPNTPAVPDNAATPFAGLEVSDMFALRTAPPKIKEQPLTEFVDHPDQVLAALVDWRAGQSVSEPSDEPQRLRLMEARANKALAVASGVTLTVDSRSAVLVPGEQTTFSINIANPGIRSIQVDEVRLQSWGETLRLKTADQLLPDTETVVTADRTTPRNAILSVPREDHLYDGLFLGHRFSADALLEIDGARFSVASEMSKPVAPAIEIKTIIPSPYVTTPATLNQPLNFKVTVTNNLERTFNGNLTIGSRQRRVFEAGRKLSLGPLETTDALLKSNALAFEGRRPAPSSGLNSGLVLLSIEPQDGGRPVTQRSVRVVYSDARVTKGLRVGFLPSFDQTLARSLAALGAQAKELRVEDLQRDLTSFDTVIIDNRGYEAHPELIAANSHLLDFVNAGGTLVVFYHKSNEWNSDPKKDRPALAPYSIVLGDERVTDENAPIRFIEPRHPLLNYPNRITPADFNGWIQERGLYFPKDWDPRYSALLSTNDAGEQPLRGGLLVGRYGKGNYIYTSLVWYRQLRAGIPGGYRMFGNMISYGHN